MALLHGDTFAYDNTAQPLKNGQAVGTSVTFGSANGFFSGDPCLDINGLTRSQILSTPGYHFSVASGTTFYVHTLVSGRSVGGTNYFIRFMNAAGGENFNINLNSNDTVNIRRGSTVLATSTEALNSTGWYHIAIEANIHDSTGSCNVKVNDVSIVSVSGADTKAQADGTFEQMYFYGTFRYWDHYTINDASGSDGFTGWRTFPYHAQTIHPNAAGNSTQWTPSIGSNYQNVDNASWDAATYNSSSTNNQRDDYNLADVGTAITGTVEGIQVRGHFQKDDAASKQVSVGIRTNSTDYDGTAAEPPVSTYSGGELLKVYGNNPNTATAFTTGEITALQASVKIRS
jgi:hypothetical protein